MEEMASGERARINRAIATAESTVGAVGDDATDAQVTAAENALSALQATINAASNVPEHERNAHTDTHGAIEARLTAAKVSREMAMDAADEAAEKARMAAEKESMEQEMAMAEETRATARKLFHAIERDREFDNAGGKATHLRLTRNLKGTSSGLITDPLTLTIENGIDPDASNENSATTTANSEGNSSNNNVYHPLPDGIPVTEMLPELAGWKGNKYVAKHPDDPLTCQHAEGCMKGITDHLVIYTNQADAENAESQTFAERYGADANDDGTLDNAWYQAETPTQMAHILAAGLTGANGHLVASDMFSTAGQEEHEGDADGMVSFRGTFDGAPGTYTCTGTGTDVCKSAAAVGTADAETPPIGTSYVELSGGASGTTWTFTPNSPDALVTLGEPVASEMFVIYGYWMRELSGDDGWTDVRPFSEIRQNGVAHGNGVAKNINGHATYTGGAAGKYAIYHPVAAESSAGAWTADAMLKADFSENIISGELTGFMSDGQPMDWKVELLKAEGFTAVDPGSRARVTTTTGFLTDGSGHGFSNAENGTVWTMGGTAGEKAGSWYGDFWMANDHPDDQATVDANPGRQPAPTSATGVFWAEHDNTAKMTGAFGVTRDEGN